MGVVVLRRVVQANSHPATDRGPYRGPRWTHAQDHPSIGLGVDKHAMGAPTRGGRGKQAGPQRVAEDLNGALRVWGEVVVAMRLESKRTQRGRGRWALSLTGHGELQHLTRVDHLTILGSEDVTAGRQEVDGTTDVSRAHDLTLCIGNESVGVGLVDSVAR